MKDVKLLAFSLYKQYASTDIRFAKPLYFKNEYLHIYQDL